MVKRSALDPTHADEDAAADPTRSLIERAYLRMRDDIINGRLAPGEKLRVEHFKTRYAVSAGTLREAITRLASDALVIAESQRGFRVTPVTVADLEDLTRLRMHIVIDALRQSIRLGSDSWRAALQRASDDMSTAEQPLRPENRTHWEVLNSRFHETLIAGCASPWTVNVLRLLSRHGERYRRYTIALQPNTGRDVHAEHREIFQLAMAGHEARAALALEAHVRTTLDDVVQAQRRGIDVFRAAEAITDAPPVQSPRQHAAEPGELGSVGSDPTVEMPMGLASS